MADPRITRSRFNVLQLARKYAYQSLQFITAGVGATDIAAKMRERSQKVADEMAETTEAQAEFRRANAERENAAKTTSTQQNAESIKSGETQKTAGHAANQDVTRMAHGQKLERENETHRTVLEKNVQLKGAANTKREDMLEARNKIVSEREQSLNKQEAKLNETKGTLERSKPLAEQVQKLQGEVVALDKAVTEIVAQTISDYRKNMGEIAKIENDSHSEAYKTLADVAQQNFVMDVTRAQTNMAIKLNDFKTTLKTVEEQKKELIGERKETELSEKELRSFQQLAYDEVRLKSQIGAVEKDQGDFAKGVAKFTEIDPQLLTQKLNSEMQAMSMGSITGADVESALRASQQSINAGLGARKNEQSMNVASQPASTDTRNIVAQLAGSKADSKASAKDLVTHYKELSTTTGKDAPGTSPAVTAAEPSTQQKETAEPPTQNRM